MANHFTSNYLLRKPIKKTSEVWFLLLAILIAASCAPASDSAPSADFTPVPTSPAPQANLGLENIRYAVVGQENTANVWSLFDESGSSYAGYATRAKNWAHLFTLDPVSSNLLPQAARALPGILNQEGEYYTAEVFLREDLYWTDNTQFIADDVAFTVNYAIAFELTHDWHTYYDAQYLHHAEAVNAHTVKFYFKQKPNSTAWEYGVLLSPILQKAFWEPKIQPAVALLPLESLNTKIAEFNYLINYRQKEIDGYYRALLLYPFDSKEYQAVELEIKRFQRELDSLESRLSVLDQQYSAQIDAAHELLFALDDQNEPLLGEWLPDGERKMKANSYYQASFTHAEFYYFPTVELAIDALQNSEADIVLSAGGVGQKIFHELENDANVATYVSTSNQVRFLAFNYNRAELKDSVLRRALNCLIDRSTFSQNIIPLETVVPPQNIFWHNRQALNECSGKNTGERRQFALDILRAAGYTWNTEPTANQDGLGLLLPHSGVPFPKITLISPSLDVDPLRAEVAEYVVQQIRSFGIPLEVRYGSAQDMVYAVYSSKQYDMAILGWQVGLLPSYLCEWAGIENPFSYAGLGFRAGCDAFELSSDLLQAQEESFKLQSAWMLEFPMIPLFVVPRYDVYRKGFPLEVLNEPFR